ncbi:unnamed protein product [Allacma fusca]|uniref:Tudor domain-containing protein n=1 Tax=Allacma fusca TaxID=39272 RepID=A0A8J2PH19_9HEXA|nr:unnamed protein product [Allacma fusca]
MESKSDCGKKEGSSGSRGRPHNSRGRYGHSKLKHPTPSGCRTGGYQTSQTRSRSGLNDGSSSGESGSHQRTSSCREPGESTLKPILEENNIQASISSVNASEENRDEILEKSLTATEELRQMIHNYYQGGPNKINFETYPLESVQNILERTEMDMAERMTNQFVYCTHAEDGPNKFTLQLKRQEDRLKLINLVLIDRIQSQSPEERIDPVDMQQYTRENFIGKMVAAPRGYSGDYARGTVVHFTNDDSVLIHFMDYGNSDEIELTRLMNSPLEFLPIKPLCFSAYLTDLSQEVARSEGTKLKFEEFVNHGELECSIKEYNPQLNMWAVHLSRKNLQGQALDVAEYLIGSTNSAMQFSGNQSRSGVPFPSSLPPPAATVNEQPQCIIKNLLEPRPNVRSTNAQPRCSKYAKFAQKQKQQPNYEKAFSVTIPEAYGGPPGHPRNLKILHIVTPSEFYVEFLFENSSSSKPGWLEDLQGKYNSQQIGKTLRPVKNVEPKQCFGWREPATSIWKRVSVVKADGKTCEVYLVDEGRRSDCRIQDLRELPEDQDRPALASRVHLAEIKSSGKSWSSKSIAFFKNWCDQVCSFKGMILPGEDKPQGHGFHRVSHGIVLVGEKNSEDCCLGTIQAALCKKALAIPLGMNCGRHDLAYSTQADIPIYQREKLQEELLISFKIKDPDSLPKSRGKVLPRRLFQYHLGYLEISTIKGPGNFYIQMKNKSHDLKKMQDDLCLVAKDLAVIPSNQCTIGDIVLGRSSGPSFLEGEETWFRVAIVSKNMNDQKALCVSIDYGFDLVIDLSTARKLPEYIRRVYPFCHRAHLDFPTFHKRYTPSDSFWSEDADGMFRRYIESFRDDVPVYYGWEVRPGNKSNFVTLEELNQKLVFDDESKQWQPGRPVKKFDHLEFNRCRDNPMLKHLFVSIGIDVKYKVVHENSKHVEYRPAWDILLEMGFVQEK